MRRLCVISAIAVLGCAHEPAPAPSHPTEPVGETEVADEPPGDEPVADEPAPLTTPADEPFVLTDGECTIAVGPVASFEVERGGYETEAWMSRLTPEQREMAESEDHFEAHGRCVLEVVVAGQRRRYLNVVTGFVVGGPSPSREQCLADRERVARHLLVMTEGCRDPDGRGVLTAP